LPNGDVVLQRTDEENSPLVAIRFSAESLAYLGEARFEVAKAMIEAGMDAASDLAAFNEYNDDPENATLTLH
jgi:hypothetical protein